MAQYAKTVWINGQAPARNATNLNKQEQGIYDNSTHVNSTHAPIDADVNLSTIEMEDVISHDNLQSINADEHIDWSLTNIKNVHIDNYTNTDTTYSVQNGELSQNNLTDVLKAAYDLAEENNVNTTLQGNTFNGINELVQLTGTGILPILDGSNLTNLPTGVSPLTTKGDIYTYSTTDARLPVGVDGYVLSADSTQATGVKWSAVSNTVTDAVKFIDTIADLALVDETIITTVNVSGYAAVGDDGGGIFNYDTSKSLINNGGTIINGWVRQYEGQLNVKWFGAKGDNVTSDTVAIRAAIDVQQATGEVVKFPKGTYKITTWADYALTSILRLVGEAGATISGEGSEDMFVNSQVGVNIKGLRFYSIGGIVIDAYINTTYNCEEYIVEDCYFENIATPFRIRTYDALSADIFAKNFHFRNNEFYNCATGLMLAANINGYSVTNNIFNLIGLPYRTYARDTLGYSVASDVICVGIGRDTQETANEASDTQGGGTISDNYFKDITSDELYATGRSCKAIDTFGAMISICNNSITNVTNTDLTATNTEGIYWKGSRCTITGNTLIDAGGSEAAIKGKGSYLTSERNIISNNIIKWTGLYNDVQVGIAQVNGMCIISNNYIENSRRNAIQTTGPDVLVTSNQIVAGSCSSVTEAKFINCNDGANIVIDGNYIEMSGVDTSYQITAIACDSSSAFLEAIPNWVCTNNVITFTNSVTSTNKVKGIYVRDEGYGAGSITIHGNTISIRDTDRPIDVIGLSISGNARLLSVQNNVNDCATTGVIDIMDFADAAVTLAYRNNIGFDDNDATDTALSDGTFLSGDGVQKTITVTNGYITNIV